MNARDPLTYCPVVGCDWTQTLTDPTPEIGESARAARRDADLADTAEQRRHLDQHSVDDFLRTINDLRAQLAAKDVAPTE